MPLTIVRQEAAARFQDAYALLGTVKQLETAKGSRVSAYANMQKGLFLVALYAALEYSVTRLVTEVSSVITSKGIPCEHVDFSLHPLMLDPELKSVATSGGKSKKWDRRTKLFERQFAADPATVHDTALQAELSNVWAASLNQVFMAFGVKNASPFYDLRVRQYIDELVDKRNQVAHGRDSVGSVGQAYTAAQLENLLSEIERQKDYLIATFDTFLAAKEYIQRPFRATY